MEKNIPSIPKKAFKPRSFVQNSSNPPRFPQYSPQIQPVPYNKPYHQNRDQRQYSEQIPVQSTSYKRPLSVASLIYPTLNIDTIQQILIDNNLVLNNAALESLSSAFKVKENSLHPFHLSDMEISAYKSVECPKKDLCPDTYCQFYHYLGEKRRVPVHYSEYLCPVYFNCPRGDACELAHNKIEQAYHPKRVMEFYQDVGEGEEYEEGCECSEDNLRKMSLRQLEGLKAKKLNEKKNVIKDLENRLIWIKKLKELCFCSGCHMERADVVTVPCGHLICDYCKIERICAQCNKDCTYYVIRKK